MAHPTPGSRRGWYIAVGIAVFVAMAILPPWWGAVESSPFRPFAVPFVAVERAISSSIDWVGGVWSRYLYLTGLSEANERLQQRLDHLTSERDALLEVATENRRLTALLGFRDRAPVPAYGARVIGRDPSRWYQSVVIDRGTHNNAVVDMGVSVPSGVVGTVVKVWSSAALVLLITDRQSAVPVVVQRTREQGILEGTIAGRTRLKYLPLSSDIQEGDVILTSGLTAPFPKGIMVGSVTAVERPDGALYPEVEVTPFADLSALEEVIVFDPQPDSLRVAD